MKFALIIVFCSTISLSASAQWWKISLKKHERFPPVTQLKDNPVSRLPGIKAGVHNYKITALNLAPGDYSLELAEKLVMKTAQHNMRFRIYDAASYNFSQLAQLYMQQNRLSEAKWYLLQSNNLSRQQNDDKHTIANLKDLAMVKANLGQLSLALQDLSEARQMAAAKGWLVDVNAVDKELNYIQVNQNSMSKTEFRYADAVESPKKTD